MRMPRKPSEPPTVPADDDPAELFRSAIGPVRVLDAPAPPARPAPPRPRPRQRDADEHEALRQMRETPFDIDAGDSALYRREDVAPRVLKRLRRGDYVIGDELDLHRMTATEAEQALRRFLSAARVAGTGCVRLVHGKGLHSDSLAGPVLKPLVERMLSQRADVLAYAGAPAAMGGSGALLVLLARRPPATRD